MYRRHRPPTSLPDLVRLGQAVPVLPTTDSGWLRYGTGRQFYPAATNLVTKPQSGAAAQASVFTYVTSPIATGLPFQTCTKMLQTTESYPGAAIVSKFAVTPGQVYTASAYLYVESIAAGGAISFSFITYNGASVVRNGTVKVSTATTTAGYVRKTVSITIAEGEDGLALSAFGLSAGKACTAYFTGVQLEAAAAATDYFDGSAAGCAWTGAVNGSTSTRTVSALQWDGLCSIASTGVTALDGQTVYKRTSGTNYGPVVLAAAPYTEAGEAALAAHWPNPLVLFGAMTVGDHLMPLIGDSVAYRKVSGASPFRVDALVVFEGDSLTQGTGSTEGNDYPSQTVRLLGAYNIDKRNLGFGGQQLADMLADAEDDIDALLPTGYPRDICVLWGGVNDISASAAAEDIEADIETFCSGRQAAGYKVIACTIAPYNSSDEHETLRLTVNTWIRGHYGDFADALADIAANEHFDAKADALDTTYYKVDGIHLTDAGYAIVAGIVKTAIESLL